MNMHKLALGIRMGLAASVLAASAAHAGPLALSEAPLTVSATIDPNVMLLVDNSGSMEAIIWHEDFEPTGSYGAWQYRNGNNWSNVGNTTNYTPSNLGQSTCSSGYDRFRLEISEDNYEYKCLRLPAPNGTSSTRYLGRYLRFLLDRFANNTDLRGGQIPNDYRMNVAREVAKDLVLNTPGMRFGLSHFNNNEGGSIAAACGTDSASIASSIDALTAETWTPLGESLYEITRYFRGMQSYFNSGTYTSPIQYRCQKNFTVVITDGLPTYDGTYPNNDPDDPNGLLPNWDGVDNDGPGGNSSTEGDALYLDDIAKFGYDIDMRKGGNDLAGESFDDPRHPKQNMYTYTIGFTVQNEMLEDAAEYGDGLYLTANNADELKEKLGEALASIQARLGASSSAATSGGSVQVGASVYQARLNSEFWTGQLLSFEVDTDRNSPSFGDVVRTGAGPDGAKWDAGSRIPSWSSRTIITNTTAGTGRPFRWANMTTAERTSHFDSTEALLEYLRGRSVTGYRSRPSLLGDIVNSAPQFVGPPNALYPPSLEATSYLDFKKNNATRPAMVYVGANDGMLHGFDAETGVERLAYVPGSLLSRLKVLADPEYNETHRFFVDGSPTVVDAFIGGSWRTVLVGGLNRGGQGIYALDVTDPASFSEGNASSTFLWEFTDANDVDLGYTYSQPAIVKLQDDTWAAVFGNGYNNTINDGRVSTSGDAVLYIVNLQTGALIKKISTGVGVAEDPTGQSRPNGLASVAPVDVDGDYVVDHIYAGDLFGNMWKFDLSKNSSGSWSLAYKLFQACAGNTCTASNRQPITSRPTVIRHPSKPGEIVLFGTGKYLEQADNISLNGGVQSFYAIWDDGKSSGGSKPVSRSLLQEQSIIFQGPVDFQTPDGNVTEELRVTSTQAVNWDTQKGWFLDLVPPSGFEGERQITNPIVRNGKVIFTTMIPSDSSDPCAPAGTSWLMELDAAKGSRLEYAPFDLTGDGKFTTDDFVTILVDGQPLRVPPSGRKFEGGNAQTPAVMGDPRGTTEFKYVSTSEGLEVIVENQGRFATGRQSWIELY